MPTGELENWTTTSTGPLCFLPSLLSDPPIRGPNAHFKVGNTRA